MKNELKNPVPPFKTDVDATFSELGKIFMYVKQLSSRLMEMAQEINEVDDKRIEAVTRCNEAERQLGDAKQRISTLNEALERSGYFELDGWIIKEQERFAEEKKPKKKEG